MRRNERTKYSIQIQKENLVIEASGTNRTDDNYDVDGDIMIWWIWPAIITIYVGCIAVAVVYIRREQ